MDNDELIMTDEVKKCACRVNDDTPGQCQGWLNTRFQKTKTTKHSLVVVVGIQDMTLADNLVV